ncbi:protein ALP1-like [Aphis craccivora]|uniref:Protein ALP1-like n=1 Tax=Aphis craccivora TaxID=307492 RepID=A0A6G0W565_APHCR|nr:protein ALP1-like [Aphis craccivora]
MLFIQLLSKNVKARITNFMSITSLYDDIDSKSHFRLTRSSIESPNIKEGRPGVNFHKATLLTIWYLSNIETFRQVETVQDFKNLRINYVLNTIGCIDGCHIRMHSEKAKRSDYTKMFQSIALLAVSNAHLEFTYILSGWPGSSHDARVFKNSSLGNTLINNPQEMISKDLHILGDSAFPLLENLLVQYKATYILSDREKLFNRRLSSTRVVIEQAFGLLLGRFRRLKSLESKSVELMSLTVTGACILHNLALKNNDLFGIEDNDQNLDISTDEIHHDVGVSIAVTQINGIGKRNELSLRFYEH